MQGSDAAMQAADMTASVHAHFVFCRTLAERLLLTERQLSMPVDALVRTGCTGSRVNAHKGGSGQGTVVESVSCALSKVAGCKLAEIRSYARRQCGCSLLC